MAAPAFLRARSFWLGLMATILIVGMWVRSSGRVVTAVAKVGGTEIFLGAIDDSCLLGWNHTGGRSGIRFYSGAARTNWITDDPTEWGPVTVDNASTFLILRVAWWSVLALHLFLCAGLALRRRKRAAAPVPDPGENARPSGNP